jgi:hypothetical protein
MLALTSEARAAPKNATNPLGCDLISRALLSHAPVILRDCLTTAIAYRGQGTSAVQQTKAEEVPSA